TGASLPEMRASSFKQDPEDLVQELRERIFRSRSGPCLAPGQLRHLYRAQGAETIESALLAHMVSCAPCLDEVNKMLKVSPLADRHPPDMLGPDGPSSSSGGRGRGSGGRSGPRELLSNRAKRRLKEIVEHRPGELRILVNGFHLGSQRVGSEV